MDAREKVSLGQRAKALLDNKLLNECFEAMEASCTRSWKASETAEEREEVWRLLKAVELLRGMLSQYVTTGKIAADNLREDGNAS